MGKPDGGKKRVKVKDENMGHSWLTVYPCKKCGQYPVWGACFLICPSYCKDSETEYNVPNGNAVRDWNRKMKPGRKNNGKSKSNSTNRKAKEN